MQLLQQHKSKLFQDWYLGRWIHLNSCGFTTQHSFFQAALDTKQQQGHRSVLSLQELHINYCPGAHLVQAHFVKYLPFHALQHYGQLFSLVVQELVNRKKERERQSRRHTQPLFASSYFCHFCIYAEVLKYPSKGLGFKRAPCFSSDSIRQALPQICFRHLRRHHKAPAALLSFAVCLAVREVSQEREATTFPCRI